MYVGDSLYAHLFLKKQTDKCKVRLGKKELVGLITFIFAFSILRQLRNEMTQTVIRGTHRQKVGKIKGCTSFCLTRLSHFSD